jgi:cytidyltransferase-like protein
MNVLVTGSFDLLHSGHVTFLQEAASYGDLFVGLGSDFSIEKYKGKKPTCNEAERLFMVKALECVKYAFINSGEGPVDFVDELEWVSMLIVNDDQHLLEKELLCKELGIEYKILERKTLPGLPVRSTTKLRELCK